MNYKINFSASALSDIKDIYNYIANNLHEIQSAKNITSKIISEIKKLKESPDCFRYYPKRAFIEHEN